MRSKSTASRIDRLPRPGEAALVLFVLVFAAFSSRLKVFLATGGSGVLPLVAIAAPLVAAVVVVRGGARRGLRFATSPVFIVGVLPYLCMTALLPVVGVIVNGYPERTLLSSTSATTAFSFMVIGAALSSRPARSWAPWVLLVIVAQLGYAIGQALYQTGGLAADLLSPLHEWDLSMADIDTFVQARSTGFYLNPNELGLWSAIAMILAWFVLSPRVRPFGVALAILTLLLSQSRGATVALAAAALAGVLMAIIGGRFDRSSLRPAITYGLVLAGAVAAAAFLGSGASLEERLGSLLRVAVEGPGADANLAGRIDYWQAVADLVAERPLGTFGSPELVLGTAVDSNWFRALAQGSAVYLVAMALLLAAPFALTGYPHRHVLWVLTILIAVAALTQTPFGYPPIALYWTLLGAALQSSVADPTAVPSQGAASAPGYTSRDFERPGSSEKRVADASHRW